MGTSIPPQGGDTDDDWMPPTLADWLSRTAIAPRWIVPGLVPAESLILVSGPRKLAHKTWFADLLALCVSEGVSYKSAEIFPKEAAPVLYIEEEGTHAGTRNRLLSMCESLNLDGTKMGNIYYVFQDRVRVDRKTWVSRIEKAIAVLGIKLVIFDAFAYIHSGIDENSIKEVRPIIETFRNFRSLGASVMFLAHTSKSDSTDLDNQVRGSGLLADCYDLHLALRSGGRGKKLTLDTLAREYESDHYEVRWKFTPRSESELIDVSLELIDRDLGQKNVSELGECLEMGQVYSHRKLREIWQIGEEKVKIAVAKLLRRGTIRQLDRGVERVSHGNKS